MTTMVSKTELKAQALEYFRQIQRTGQPVVVTEHGKPVLQIRRWQGQDRNPLEVLRGSVRRYDRPTDPVADDEWEILG